ncbi:hypothetical protein [Paracoccus sp. (in: a-proteobacteria)]|uniref:hypothetical protein n=1 Tax=Paracoccus sp. TaxID=267 RepID=UPI0026DED191|nr:hypothetical protein [Paracoccus sp. (in: a-proteobacteria)]MDO5646329.1 hypothetical protein [Paracoccus sp. (in: a-proteobacteria)]
MTQDDQKTLGRAFLMVVEPKDVMAKQGTPKPLRPQARRLARELAGQRLRERYVAANVWAMVAAMSWLAAYLVPSSFARLDAQTICFCFNLVTLVALLLAIFRGLTMGRGLTIPNAI